MLFLKPVAQWGDKDLCDVCIKSVAILRQALHVEDYKKAQESVKNIETSELEVLQNCASSPTGKMILKSIANDCKEFVLQTISGTSFAVWFRHWLFGFGMLACMCLS